MKKRMNEVSYANETRESIITRLRDAVTEGGGCVDYDIVDNGGYWEYGTVYEDYVVSRSSECEKDTRYDFDDLDTDILQDILDNI